MPCPHCGGTLDSNKDDVGRVGRMISQNDKSSNVQRIVAEREKQISQDLYKKIESKKSGRVQQLIAKSDSRTQSK